MLRLYSAGVLLLVGFAVPAQAQQPARRPVVVARPGLAATALTLDVQPVGPMHEIPLAEARDVLSEYATKGRPAIQNAGCDLDQRGLELLALPKHLELKVLPHQGETLFYEGDPMPLGTRLLSVRTRGWGGCGLTVYALMPLLANSPSSSLAPLGAFGGSPAARRRARAVHQSSAPSQAPSPGGGACFPAREDSPPSPRVSDLQCITPKTDSASVRIDATRRILFVGGPIGPRHLELWNGAQLERTLDDVWLVRDGAGRYWLSRWW
jgi:hypothetical protein